VTQHDPAAVAPGGELEARERVDGGGVGADVTDVAQLESPWAMAPTRRALP
jgi:hypothetical protein